jgi:hypothetical protein
MYWKIICIFNNILQKLSSQKFFLWKSENDHKKDYNLESIIVGSSDYDHIVIYILDN